MALDPVRLAICDEVGLGKTISAGAAFVELKARGKVKRTLVVAPKGVQLQWVAELAEKFGEEFVRVGAGGLPVDAGINPWLSFDQVVCSLDSVKPLRTRIGWDADRVEQYNRLRFQALVEAGWDLVIFDEAHHVAASGDEVARHKLARELSVHATHCLLLSATPHSGKSDSFRRFLGLIDADFLQGAELSRKTVGPRLVRTEKRAAKDNHGRPLFTDRTTRLEVVPYVDRDVERELYECVTRYVREGYGRSLRERRPAVGFLVLLMQRLVSSSTAAIRVALERRLAAIEESPDLQLRISAERSEDWDEMTGEEQLDVLSATRGLAWESERAEVETLLEQARGAEAQGLDAKALFFLDLVRRVQREDGSPGVKLLVFTEFLPTQEMILTLLENAGFDAVSISGSMSLTERALAQDAFKGQAQVLVSTDAGGEGINLQFAHVVVNWDMPWSPAKLEQRIGRVDRIGQRFPVRAFNLVMENSIDARVLDVLEEKLETILSELGADKRGDLIETASSGTGRLYADAVVAPDSLKASADAFADATRILLAEQAQIADLLASPPGTARTTGERLRNALWTAADARSALLGQRGADPLLALEGVPPIVPGEPVPIIAGDEPGWWCLWEIRADADSDERGAFSVFVGDDGVPRPHIAERIWDLLSSVDDVQTGPSPPSATWEKLAQLGIDYGYHPLVELSRGRPIRNPVVRLVLLTRVDT